MKIGSGSGFGQVERSERGTTQSPLNKSGDNGSTAAVSSTDSVQLSGLSSRLQDLEKTLSATPAFDAGRVKEITEAIRDGKFTVNSEVVADKLIQSVRDLVANSA